MIENLQDELYELENKQAKSAKLWANVRWDLGAKNAPTLSSKYLQDRICKIKQHLNYIHWWYKSKYSSNLQISKKKIYEKLYTKKTTSEAATTEFLCKIPNRKKISNKGFNLCETETSLDEIRKSLFSNK